MLKKLFGLDPLSRVLKEYNTIKDLETKTMVLKEKIDIEDEAQVQIVDTQLQMLKSNFVDIAKLFELENANAKFDVNKPLSLLNMKCTKPLVHTAKYSYYKGFPKIDHPNGDLLTNKVFSVIDDMYLDIIKFELSFKRVLECYTVNKKAKEKIKKQMIKKIVLKIVTFCDSLGDNSESVKNYIFFNMSLDKLEELSIEKVITRFNEMISFDIVTKSFGNYIAFKDFITIDELSLSSNITDLLRAYKTNDYDFILLSKNDSYIFE